ncbi:MAG: ABC transporter ATP-binding protein [Chloroflexia bacterium]|nr:ABC transporter ATP-binding protein [Chloroflexia bacterium]
MSDVAQHRAVVSRSWPGCGSPSFQKPIAGASDVAVGGSARFARLTSSNQWQFFRALSRASRGLAITWLSLIVARGLLPIALVLAIGDVVASVGDRDDNGALARGLSVVAIVYTLAQVLASLHAQVSVNLGDRMSTYLHDQLLDATLTPDGFGHMESSALTDRLAVAQDFDTGRSAPPMDISIGIIAGGLVEFVVGLGQMGVLATYRWWVALLIGTAWISTHWLLRNSTTSSRLDYRVQAAQRRADYTYRLAVDPPAAKEVRLFGLSEWSVDQFTESCRQLVYLRWKAIRIREKSIVWAIVLLAGVNLGLFGLLARDAANGVIDLAEIAVYAQAAVGVAALAFGGLNWALPPAAESVALVEGLRRSMAGEGRLTGGQISPEGMPAKAIAFRNMTFTYPGSKDPVLDGLDLTIESGTSVAIVGVNGAGKTTLVKLACRLYDPDSGGIDVDGIDLRDLAIASWRSRLAVVFQDFARYDLPVRDNVAPLGAPDDLIWEALNEAGATSITSLDTVLAKGYDDGTDLSGGQWHRIVIARALCAVKQGAELVILDEPTAQLDVRGEIEIFDRILEATRDKTTILISHRFSTVRRVDKIFVIEGGRVVELGNHEALMAAQGRYRAMFDLQASRFVGGQD